MYITLRLIRTVSVSTLQCHCLYKHNTPIKLKRPYPLQHTPCIRLIALPGEDGCVCVGEWVGGGGRVTRISYEQRLKM